MKFFPLFQRVMAGSLVAGGALLAVPAEASISLSSTRLVVQESKQEASISVRNGGSPTLIQAWLDSDASNATDDLPFAVTPPLAKVAPNGQQLMRVLYAGGDSRLPADRESVVWLNVQEIPQSTNQENQLQIAVRQRIKVFFRPASMTGAVADAPGALRWELVQESGRAALQVTNPSMYHVSFSYLGIAGGKELPAPGMIKPGETRMLPADGVGHGSKLAYKIINDFGGIEDYRVEFSGASAGVPIVVNAD
ncbi:phytochrome sensor protein [Achromobacter sp. RTa]|uniref:fimbrial biogenesis chaperone n=1 Tax=Achromobacter sp. RTa TaxID=1532557 RepID=UPI00050E037A|nr:molecular chaperone [Achromobacter sp. RTa]KGD90454.1 phytochrome sensor protein [Achromobacter sp. RTa]